MCSQFLTEIIQNLYLHIRLQAFVILICHFSVIKCIRKREKVCISFSVCNNLKFVIKNYFRIIDKEKGITFEINENDVDIFFKHI